ncbi:MAG: hypothetical protein MUF81_20320 [Verrucomicrobia bacterium]|nr:hypothetical protein [Verrucomicrobiota bacterium]
MAILVLGVVRLGWDAGWDRMEHIANDDRLDAALLQPINARLAAAGREVFRKKIADAPRALAA